jgi:phosphoglycerate dehydrogenase-like enzyme
VSAPKVRLLVASPLKERLARRIAESDPRVELLWDPSLIPPARWPGDHRGDPAFELDAAGRARWEELLSGAEVLYGLPGDQPAGLADAAARAPGLRWVQATAAGAGEQVRAAELPRDALLRVTVTTAGGVHAVPLAEFALFGLLAVAKDVRQLVRDQASRTWGGRRATRELRSETLFVVGLGGIGLEVARLAKAFGMRTVGFKRTPAATPPPWTDELRTSDQLGATIHEADAVVLSLPATPATAGLIDRATIARMRQEAILVNLGRGAVIDEDALVEALRERRIAGAVLDVVTHEPLPPSSPLWQLDNVLLSPHTAALSPHEDERVVARFVENLHRYLAGEPLRNVVKPGNWY